ncbi:MAG: phosphate acyltransferase PlsX [Mariprofundaceae bacterium]|nr:phosphate acyltransferase PlsX [Mariprofundaceae bacterium]
MSPDSQEGRTTRILLDGHGGDGAPGIVIDALVQALDKSDSGLVFGIVGRSDLLLPVLRDAGIAEQVELVEAADIIDMCEAPIVALRRKKNSSIHVGARAVRDGYWDALVSAGNTGALMAISMLILKTIPGIDRPALASTIPAVGGGSTFFLDIGANVDCTSEHLLQFAVMGSCYLQAAEGIESPRVGLLNIGSEDIKGTDVVKVAATKLRDSGLNFIGNVEGTDLFGDSVDVVVCDGFVGNVSLKTMEGVAKLILYELKSELTSSIIAKTGALLASGALHRVKDALNPSEHNGAPLLGLNGIVVKSHGSADAHGYLSAIDVAVREVRENLIDITVKTMNAMAET